MRQIVFNVRLFGSEAARPYSERVMGLLLEGLTMANQLYLAEHPNTPQLYHSGVRYEREPDGCEDWDGIETVLSRGWGDCEDLACWRCAEARMAGIPCKPAFYFRRVPDPALGPLSVYHIVCQFPGGRIEDPSRLLGMKSVA